MTEFESHEEHESTQGKAGVPTLIDASVHIWSHFVQKRTHSVTNIHTPHFRLNHNRLDTFKRYF